jgi:integrase
MSRAARNFRLESREARRKLRARSSPYWVRINKGVSLGYWKGLAGGTWRVRLWNHQASEYETRQFANVDDHADSDQLDVLTFFEAQQKANELAAEARRGRKGLAPLGGTVGQAADAYLNWLSKHKKSNETAKQHVEKFILPTFDRTLLDEIMAPAIKKWHENLAVQPRRKRTRLGMDQKHELPPQTDEDKRKRKSSANRVLTTFKALLNKAFQDGLATNDTEWRRVKPFKQVDAARIRYLKTDEATRLVNSCAPALRILVRGALYTGARYAELGRMKVSDVNIDGRSVYISQSKNGRARHVPLGPEGVQCFKEISIGRSPSDFLLLTGTGKTWTKNLCNRPLTDAMALAKLEDYSFHDLRHTYASQLAQNGVDLLSISKLLGHSDTRITARHYAHLCDEYLKHAAAKLPSFGFVANDKVVSIF